MRRRRTGARLALLACVATLVAGGGVAAYETHFLRKLELDSVDQRFAIRGHQATPRDIVVVAIDSATFGQLQTRWPFPRSYHARVVRNLKRDGARVIAYDVQFTEPTEPREDQALFDAVREAGNVVLGTSEVDRHGHTRIFGGDAAVRAARALPASAQYNLDPGGVIRRVPYETDGLRSFSAVAARRAWGKPVPRAPFEPDGAWIDFVGPPHSIRTVPFWQVYEGRVPPSLFRGKVVVVGAEASSLQDVHATSSSGAGEMSGPEIQANAIDTIHRGVPLRGGAEWLDIALIVLLALAAPLASLWLAGLWALVAGLAALAGFVVASQLAFDGGTILAFIYPAGAGLLSTFGALGVHYFTEVRERRRTRAAFARFVPHTVVDRVLEQAGDALRLGGEEVLGTVLFSDIRGFTTFSEQRPAGDVIDILNHYLTEMTEAILGHGGTLVAYLGDGILAVFGAPLPQEDHADRALAAAQEMLGPRLTRFNEWARERGIEESFRMGIGMNSGLFMAGNVGSDQRLEYTVIGDPINTASRIEGLTKGSGHSLLVAESTMFMLTGDPPPLAYAGEFEIRGRAAKIKLWAPADGGAAPAPDDREPRGDERTVAG